MIHYNPIDFDEHPQIELDAQKKKKKKRKTPKLLVALDEGLYIFFKRVAKIIDIVTHESIDETKGKCNHQKEFND